LVANGLKTRLEKRVNDRRWFWCVNRQTFYTGIFTIWQHLVLLTIRQYEGKSYRMFVEWLFEAYYLRMFLQLSHTPHYTTLQRFSSRINGTLLENIISSFILLLTNIRKIFTGIDSTGFKITHTSQYYYPEQTGLRRKYVKLSMRVQIICTIKIRRAPTRHDTIDFRPIITRTSDILPLSVDVITSRLVRTQTENYHSDV
jgi:hypothetical protein